MAVVVIVVVVTLEGVGVLEGIMVVEVTIVVVVIVFPGEASWKSENEKRKQLKSRERNNRVGNCVPTQKIQPGPCR